MNGTRAPFLRHRRALWAVLALGALAAWAAGLASCGSINYFDSCQRLALRICNCEPTSSRRQACQQERITQQLDNVDTSQAGPSCDEALLTCTCEALEQNQTHLCGYSRDAEGYLPLPDPSPDAEPDVSGDDAGTDGDDGGQTP